MQPSSGEMPSSAQTPQNVNSSAMANDELIVGRALLRHEQLHEKAKYAAERQHAEIRQQREHERLEREAVPAAGLRREGHGDGHRIENQADHIVQRDNL